MPQFLARPNLRKYLANTSWLMGERVIRMVVSLFVGIYVIRFLGPERFGILSYVLSFVLLFSPLLHLGHREIIVLDLVKSPEKRDLILGSAILLRLGGSVLLLGGVSVGIQFVENDQQTLLMIGIISIGIMFQSWELVDYYFQSQVQSKYTVWAQTIQLIVVSLCKLSLIYWQASLFWFVIVFSIEYVILAILYLIMYIWRVGWFPIRRCNLKYTQKLLKNSLPLLFSTMAIMIYMKIDQIMLKELVGAASVGIYSAAVKLCEVWYQFPVLIAGSYYPVIIAAKASNSELYYSYLQKLYSFLIWGAIAIAIPTTIFSDWIIHNLYGNEFAKSVVILQIYAWASVFVFMGVANHKWLLIENCQKYILLTTLLGMVINIVCNIILIPLYGASGAAVASLISYGIGSYGSLLFFPRLRVAFWLATKSFNPFLHFSFKQTS
jgi:O-antigen/teichoic acid export membrane protein